jgi:hypothetical protein
VQRIIPSSISFKVCVLSFEKGLCTSDDFLSLGFEGGGFLLKSDYSGTKQGTVFYFLEEKFVVSWVT